MWSLHFRERYYYRFFSRSYSRKHEVWIVVRFSSISLKPFRILSTYKFFYLHWYTFSLCSLTTFDVHFNIYLVFCNFYVFFFLLWQLKSLLTLILSFTLSCTRTSFVTSMIYGWNIFYIKITIIHLFVFRLILTISEVYAILVFGLNYLVLYGIIRIIKNCTSIYSLFSRCWNIHWHTILFNLRPLTTKVMFGNLRHVYNETIYILNL